LPHRRGSSQDFDPTQQDPQQAAFAVALGARDRQQTAHTNWGDTSRSEVAQQKHRDLTAGYIAATDRQSPAKASESKQFLRLSQRINRGLMVARLMFGLTDQAKLIHSCQLLLAEARSLERGIDGGRDAKVCLGGPIRLMAVRRRAQGRCWAEV